MVDLKLEFDVLSWCFIYMWISQEHLLAKGIVYFDCHKFYIVYYSRAYYTLALCINKSILKKYICESYALIHGNSDSTPTNNNMAVVFFTTILGKLNVA